jgi:hypothetical protein
MIENGSAQPRNIHDAGIHHLQITDHPQLGQTLLRQSYDMPRAHRHIQQTDTAKQLYRLHQLALPRMLPTRTHQVIHQVIAAATFAKTSRTAALIRCWQFLKAKELVDGVILSF